MSQTASLEAAAVAARVTRFGARYGVGQTVLGAAAVVEWNQGLTKVTRLTDAGRALETQRRAGTGYT